MQLNTLMMFTVLPNNICPPVTDTKYPMCYVTKPSNVDTISSNVWVFSEIQSIVAG